MKKVLLSFSTLVFGYVVENAPIVNALFQVDDGRFFQMVAFATVEQIE